jgi:Uncharacterized membrane-anchored protein conserved in bacteria
MKLTRFVLVYLGLALAAIGADAPAEEAPPQTREEAFERAGVKLTRGPATVSLGKVAELKLPEGFAFVGEDSLDRFYELTQNIRGGNEVGVLMAPRDWMLFFDYDEIGYVKDDEKDKLDAGKLLATMQENQAAANESRKERGWDQMKLVGWATQPHYDEKSKNLKWALNLSSSHDNFQDMWINESIRILGRGGVMNITLVSEVPNFKAAEDEADQLLARHFSYLPGQRYSEFKAGDKVAKYGLTALVLGGGAAAAAKLGLLAKLGAFLGKAWKLVVGALVVVFVGIKKILAKIVGARPVDEAKP